MTLLDRMLGKGEQDSDVDLDEMEKEIERWQNRMNRHLTRQSLTVRPRRPKKNPPQQPWMGVK